MCRQGVNVDQCTRFAEAAMCGNAEYYAREIYAIPNEREKVRIFRNKSPERIEVILTQLSEEIRKSVIGKYYRDSPQITIDDIELSQSSDDNRDSADLLHICNGMPINIEVKFGSETSRNIGMGVFDNIFGTSVFSNATSLPIRKEWERQFIAEGRNMESQYGRLFRAINLAIEEFNDFNAQRGFVLPAANQEYMERIILNTTGDGSNDGEFMKFVLDGDSFTDFKKIPTGIGCWTIHRTETVDGVNVLRAVVVVRNYDTNVQIKYVLNWKNNHKIDGNPEDKVPAKLGLGTPNWNVWVEVEVSQITAT